jgi:hypothetical protein
MLTRWIFTKPRVTTLARVLFDNHIFYFVLGNGDAWGVSLICGCSVALSFDFNVVVVCIFFSVDYGSTVEHTPCDYTRRSATI